MVWLRRKNRSEIASSAACRCGSSLLAEAVPRWNSRMDSRAPRIQPSVLREDRIAARLARVVYRYRDCHQIERLIIHSDGGIDIRFRDPRPDHAHSSRSAVAHVGSMGPTTPRARPVLSPRQVKKNKKSCRPSSCSGSCGGVEIDQLQDERCSAVRLVGRCFNHDASPR